MWTSLMLFTPPHFKENLMEHTLAIFLVSMNHRNPPIILNQEDNLSPLDSGCLLYTSPSPRDRTRSRMPSSA